MQKETSNLESSVRERRRNLRRRDALEILLKARDGLIAEMKDTHSRWGNAATKIKKYGHETKMQVLLEKGRDLIMTAVKGDKEHLSAIFGGQDGSIMF